MQGGDRSADDLGRLVTGAVLQADVLRRVAEDDAAVAARRLANLQACAVEALRASGKLSSSTSPLHGRQDGGYKNLLQLAMWTHGLSWEDTLPVVLNGFNLQ